MILVFSSFSYSQFAIFTAENFDRQIKDPNTLEQVKDVFQGVWIINIYSPNGEVVDTVVTKLQNYSAKRHNFIRFDSKSFEPLVEAKDSQIAEGNTITFFQSETKSTIRFVTGNQRIIDFDGVIQQDLSIAATAVSDGTQGYKLTATKLTTDLGSIWVCGNDDGKKEEDPKHGRHCTRQSQEIKEFERTHGCTKWKMMQYGR
jgi:hypothetical protein